MPRLDKLVASIRQDPVADTGREFPATLDGQEIIVRCCLETAAVWHPPGLDTPADRHVTRMSRLYARREQVPVAKLDRPHRPGFNTSLGMHDSPPEEQKQRERAAHARRARYAAEAEPPVPDVA